MKAGLSSLARVNPATPPSCQLRFFQRTPTPRSCFLVLLPCPSTKKRGPAASMGPWQTDFSGQIDPEIDARRFRQKPCLVSAKKTPNRPFDFTVPSTSSRAISRWGRFVFTACFVAAQRPLQWASCQSASERVTCAGLGELAVNGSRFQSPVFCDFAIGH